MLDRCPSNGARRSLRAGFALGPALALGLAAAAGRHLRRLAAGQLGAGTHTRRWDGKNDRGRPVPAGVYFAELAAGGARRTVRMVRLGR